MRKNKIILLMITLMLVGVLYGCGYDLKVGKINENQVLEEQNVFTGREDVGFQLTKGKPFNTKSINFVLLEVDNGIETIIDDDDIAIDPSWEYFIIPYKGLYRGEYIIKFYDGKKVIGTEKFTMELGNKNE